MTPKPLPDRGPARWLALFLNMVSAVTLFGLMVITCLDVFGRYLFNHPLMGATELTEMGLAILLFSAFPVISWRNEQIVVDMLDRFTPPWLHLLRTLLLNLVGAIALYFLGKEVIKLGNRSLDYGEVSEFLAIPLGWTIDFIGVMCWLTSLALLTLGIHRALDRYRHHKTPDGTVYR